MSTWATSFAAWGVLPKPGRPLSGRARLGSTAVGALFNLAYHLWLDGCVDEAIACQQRAAELSPGDAQIYSGLLFMLQCWPQVSLQVLADAHAEYQRRFAAPLQASWQPHDNPRIVPRRLRLAIVSPLFWRNPAAQLSPCALGSAAG